MMAEGKANGPPGGRTSGWECRRLEGGCPSQMSGTRDACPYRAELDWERRHLGGAWEGNGPVAGVGAGRFAGLAPAAGTAGTTGTAETTGIVPGRRFALEIGSRASRGPMAGSASIAFAQANGQARQHGLPFPGGLGGPGGPGPPTGKWHSFRAARQFPVAFLSGGPPTSSGNSMRHF